MRRLLLTVLLVAGTAAGQARLGPCKMDGSDCGGTVKSVGNGTISGLFTATWATATTTPALSLAMAAAPENTFLGGPAVATIPGPEPTFRAIEAADLGTTMSPSFAHTAITNQSTPGLSAGTATTVTTGGPNTRGLVVRGTTYTTTVARSLAFGQGTDTIAYSADGASWTGLGATIFSNYGNGAAWNGTRFVAAGVGAVNTLAHSTDGINWTGLGNGIFSNGGTAIAWNGSKFVAVGDGTANTMAYSANGTDWTGLGTTIFDTFAQGIAWNGSVFVALGEGSANTMAYSANGVDWTGLGKTIFSATGQYAAWDGTKFVAAGQGTTNSLAHSTNGVDWTGLGKTIFSNAYGIAWNGTVFVAVGSGSNSIAYSANGTSWTGLGKAIFSSYGNRVAWNGTRFIAAGSGTNSLAYSTNGVDWTGLGEGVFESGGYGVASAPAPSLVPATGGVPSSTAQTANLQDWESEPGSVKASVTAGGNFLAPIGSAAAPSFAFAAYPDDGIFHYSGLAGYWHFVAGGGIVATVQAAGISFAGGMFLKTASLVSMTGLTARADNAAALAAGLVAGDLYYTDVAGEYVVKVVH